MPDRLDERFAQVRAEVQQEIRVPELSRVRGRARTLRRRRRGLAAAASTLALVAVGVGTVVSVPSAPAPQPAASTTTAPRWSGAGVTLHGLDGAVTDLTGDLVDLDFAATTTTTTTTTTTGASGDDGRGYALSMACASPPRCLVGFAETADGGHTWSVRLPPLAEADPDQPPHLIATPDGVLVDSGDHTSFRYAPTGSVDWALRPRLDEAVERIPDGGRLWTSSQGCGGEVLAIGWGGAVHPLATQPGIDVCTVAAGPAADGAWWVGGTIDGGAPAVARSRDDGRTWTVTRLPGTGTAEVSTLGNRVYVSVVAPRGGDPFPTSRRLEAVYRSVDGGPFESYVDEPTTVLGEVVPLLDDRLLLAGPDWQVSAGRGQAFARPDGSLPWVRRFDRTPGGWVAYDLFREGWAAVSTNGTDWRKLTLR